MSDATGFASFFASAAAAGFSWAFTVILFKVMQQKITVADKNFLIILCLGFELFDWQN